MRSLGSGAKGRLAAAAGIVTAVLTAASFAWACTASNESLTVTPEFGPPGQAVTIEGRSWAPGTVQVYLVTDAGNMPLATVTPGTGVEGRFTVRATIPKDVKAGVYFVKGVRFDAATKTNVVGNTATAFEVLAPKVQPAPSRPAANTQPPVSQSVVDSTPATPVAPAPAQPTVVEPPAASQPSPVADVTSQPVPAASQPVPEVAGPPAAGAPVAADAWTGRDTTRTSQPGLVGQPRSAGDNRGLLAVGAGLLGMGSVALFAGFTVAVARRRRALAIPGSGL